MEVGKGRESAPLGQSSMFQKHESESAISCELGMSESLERGVRICTPFCRSKLAADTCTLSLENELRMG